MKQSLTGDRPSDTKGSPETPAQTSLQAEAASLEEVLKNQAHPKDLVAIKKSGTPVVSTPSLTGKTLFMASAHDEFEMLDFNEDWVHVRISGLSRGWIWRTSLEMPEGISDVPTNSSGAMRVAADLFQVTREETARLSRGLGATAQQKRENHLSTKDTGERGEQRSASEAGIREISI